MVLVGDETQVEARFYLFGDSTNLDSRSVHCNTLGVCHSLSSGFELKYDILSGDDIVKVNLWR
jgi:hypothetical protein